MAELDWLAGWLLIVCQEFPDMMLRPRTSQSGWRLIALACAPLVPIGTSLAALPVNNVAITLPWAVVRQRICCAGRLIWATTGLTYRRHLRHAFLACVGEQRLPADSNGRRTMRSRGTAVVTGKIGLQPKNWVLPKIMLQLLRQHCGRKIPTKRPNPTNHSKPYRTFSQHWGIRLYLPKRYRCQRPDLHGLGAFPP
jgi:hypothetical protein